MGSRWRGRREDSCRLVVNNIYLWKMLFLLQNALSFQAPSFGVDLMHNSDRCHQSRFYIQILTALLNCWSINPQRKCQKYVYISLYSVERLKLRKKLVAVKSNRLRLKTTEVRNNQVRVLLASLKPAQYLQQPQQDRP